MAVVLLLVLPIYLSPRQGTGNHIPHAKMAELNTEWVEPDIFQGQNQDFNVEVGEVVGFK